MKVESIGSRVLTPDLMQEKNAEIFHVHGVPWDEIRTSPSIRRYYEGLWTGGIDGKRYWRGCPVVADKMNGGTVDFMRQGKLLGRISQVAYEKVSP